MTLFLFVAKLAWLALRPSNLLWIVALLALVLIWRRRRVQVAAVQNAEAQSLAGGLGRSLMTAALTAYLVLASPLGHMPLWALEQRFEPCRFDQLDADVVAVLGGAVKTNLSNQVGQITVGDASERLLALAALARAPNAPLIVASGGTLALRGTRNESQWISHWLTQIGVPGGRVSFEAASLNTFQNALEIEAVLPDTARRLAVVTSAFHMPRAVGVFRAAGFEVQACPVDFRVNLLQVWGYPDAAGALVNLDIALHEALGLVAYYATGRSTAWFPGPQGPREG